MHPGSVSGPRGFWYKDKVTSILASLDKWRKKINAFQSWHLEMKELYTVGEEVNKVFSDRQWVPTAVTWVPSVFSQAPLRLGVPRYAVELSGEELSVLMTPRAELLRSGSLGQVFWGVVTRPGFCWHIPHSFPGAWQEYWPPGNPPLSLESYF